jgi:glutaredoxin
VKNRSILRSAEVQKVRFQQNFLMDEVNKKISESNIVVFATSSCPYCSMAINAYVYNVYNVYIITFYCRLNTSGHQPTVVYVTSNQRESLRSKTSVSSVPYVFIKGGIPPFEYFFI